LVTSRPEPFVEKTAIFGSASDVKKTKAANAQWFSKRCNHRFLQYSQDAERWFLQVQCNKTLEALQRSRLCCLFQMISSKIY